MSESASFLLSAAPRGFGSYGPEDELLHPQFRDCIVHEALTETQYFGFNVPAQNVHGFAYLWFHPNTGNLTGGIAAWRGIKTTHLASELYDYRLFMSDKQIKGNIDRFQLTNGYAVEVIEPFKQMRIQYEDAARGNTVDIAYTAVSPPAMLPNGKHFEQTMRTKGFVKLRGTTYEVDGYNVRDRSWGEARKEEHLPFPPIVWLTGVFGDDFSFNCTLTDHPALNPEWQGLYDISESQVLKGGWIYRNGRHTRVIDSRKLTRRDPTTLRPLSHELLLIDEDGERFELHGSIIASAPAGFHANVSNHVGLARWECRGRIGWGDSQESQFSDFVYAMQAGKRAPS
jgi:hypothetical protein